MAGPPEGSATIVPPSGLTGSKPPPAGTPPSADMSGGGIFATGGGPAGGEPAAEPANGAGAEPAIIGATPTIVPLSLLGVGPWPVDGGPAVGGAPAAGEGAPAAGRGPVGALMSGMLFINMVPLNFGAAAPFRLNPHLPQVTAVSGF
jgi:hypothetical protein